MKVDNGMREFCTAAEGTDRLLPIGEHDALLPSAAAEQSLLTMLELANDKRTAVFAMRVGSTVLHVELPPDMLRITAAGFLHAAEFIGGKEVLQ